jgi:hypothetical protein
LSHAVTESRPKGRLGVGTRGIRSIDCEVAVHEVIRESRFGIAHGGEVLLPSIDTLEPGLSHEAFDALLTDVDALAQDELGVHAWAAIGAA